MDSSKLIVFALMLLLSICLNVVEGRTMRNDMVKRFSETSSDSDMDSTKWAILVAGSKGYDNYRHQADICHAYQLLRKGGLKDENIIVFMYDDIAYNVNNPSQGVIINRPQGENVYVDVPHDYTGDNASTSNFFNVLLGNEIGIGGGSGKVLKTGINDEIFIFYSGHGSPGVLGMPGYEMLPLYASDLIYALKEMAASGYYDTMVIYVEACHSGSMFENLPNNLSIYVTTASNPDESSYPTYCVYDSRGRWTCLGDLYSVSWMEDSEQNDLTQETLGQQYAKVQQRTSISHVMKYGDLGPENEVLALYFVGDFDILGYEQQKNDNHSVKQYVEPIITPMVAVEQQEASMHYFLEAASAAPEGSLEKKRAKKELAEVISHRKHVECTISEIGKVIFDTDDYYEMIMTVRSPVVDDWNCYKTLVATYQTHCGTLSMYGMKYMQAFANMCNAGFRQPQLSEVASQVCGDVGRIIPACKGL